MLNTEIFFSPDQARKNDPGISAVVVGLEVPVVVRVTEHPRVVATLPVGVETIFDENHPNARKLEII